jgi:hypothetical protein
MGKYSPRRPWFAAIFIPAICVSPPAEAGDVTFIIQYIDEIEQVSPSVASYNVDQHVTVTLHDGNKVTEQRVWKSPNQSSSIGTAGAFGETVPAGKFSVKWKVESQNALIRYREFPQHIETMRIVVSGKTCEATISHELKKGFSEYERFGSGWKPAYYRSLRSSGITCSVKES